MNMETREGMIEYVNKICDLNNYILNKDPTTFDDLIDGLLENKKTHGYQSCPCRLATGNKKLDRDLICPCDYAPLDIKEFGACYCNLYMSPDFYDKGVEYVVVPERRPFEKTNAVQDYLLNL